MRVKIITLLFVILYISSCKKTETKVISGNVPQTDSTIDNVLRNNFIHKSYLAIIGRTPTELERIGARSVIDKNGCTLEDRESFLKILFAAPDYKENLFNIDNASLLGSSSSATIDAYINYYANLVKDTTNPQYYMNKDYVIGLKILQAAPRNYFNDAIDLVELHKRMTHNILFENFNGGIYNWTNAIFPYFFKRKPTDAELTNSYSFIQGIQGKLLLKTGNSVNDMVDIVFSSDEYYEGQVRTLFLRHLYREPNNNELSTLSESYKKDHNYLKLQKAIFLSNDFIGKK